MQDELWVIHVQAATDVPANAVLFAELARWVAATEENVKRRALVRLQVVARLGLETRDTMTALLYATGMQHDDTAEERELVDVAEKYRYACNIE